MRYFLDMNLPVYFCMQIGHPLEKKAKLFVENKGGSFLLCDYIVNRNLPRWLKRQMAVLFEFNQKVQNQNYNLFSSEQSRRELFLKDKMFANKLLFSYGKSKDKKQFAKNINQIFNLLEARISYFVRVYIDEVVIPESEIDSKLRGCLSIWLRNDSDVRTIASAIQEHKNKKLIIMTADKKDWTRELLEEVHNDIELSRVYVSLPGIEYLQNYNPR